jgi:hypothetical protein
MDRRVGYSSRIKEMTNMRYFKNSGRKVSMGAHGSLSLNLELILHLLLDKSACFADAFSPKFSVSLLAILFVLGRSLVQISNRRPSLLTYLDYFQAQHIELHNDSFLECNFQLIIHY